MATSLDPQSGEDAETRSRRPYILGFVAILVVAAAIWGFRAWTYAQSHEGTDDAQVDGRVIPVLARVGGYVRGVTVAENDSVKGGQLLVQIDDAEHKQRLAQADADVAAAEASAGAGAVPGQAEAQVNIATNQGSSLQSQITAARATAARAMADLARNEGLAKQDIISKQQLDALRATAETAQANVEALEQQASAAGATVSGAQAGVRLARARRAAALAARDYAALQLQYTKVVAPEGGTVARKNVEIGQLVQPGQPLMAVVADTGVWVTANFKETQLAELRIGQPVEIDVDAYDGCKAEGRVASISPATGAKFALLPPDNATGNFTKVVQRIPVRIRITGDCGKDRPMRAGLSVTVSIKTK